MLWETCIFNSFSILSFNQKVIKMTEKHLNLVMVINLPNSFLSHTVSFTLR